MASPQLPAILFSEIISKPGTLFLYNEHSLNEQIINMYINMYIWYIIARLISILVADCWAKNIWCLKYQYYSNYVEKHKVLLCVYTLYNYENILTKFWKWKKEKKCHWKSIASICLGKKMTNISRPIYISFFAVDIIKNLSQCHFKKKWVYLGYNFMERSIMAGETGQQSIIARSLCIACQIQSENS